MKPILLLSLVVVWCFPVDSWADGECPCPKEWCLDRAEVDRINDVIDQNKIMKERIAEAARERKQQAVVVESGFELSTVIMIAATVAAGVLVAGFAAGFVIGSRSG